MIRTIVIPTLNAAADWPDFAAALLACVAPEEVLVIDSASNDGTAALARAAGFQVHEIARAAFNHGGTRQLAAEMLPQADLLVFLTQDAVLQGASAIKRLLGAFEDASVAAAYGRQLPRRGATPIEAHGRYFNYPDRSNVRDFAARSRWGFKTIFLSNSFAAYRRSALMGVGGFPTDVIFGEDTVLAAKLVMAGWKIAYVADAEARHSHAYSWRQEFRRYFDIGVLHHRESWLLQEFGQANGEGKRFVLSEWKYLWPKQALLLPSAVIRTGLKLVGYRLGRLEHHMGNGLKRRLSMHPRFWK